MQHSFDVEIAKRYGVNCAIILNNLYFWVEKNRANERHFYDGYYWTYNSKKAFSELMPYLSPKQVDYAIKKLIDEGILITGNYNKSAYDRTLWYAITDFGYSILQNCKMERTFVANGNDDIGQPIPDINTDIKLTDNKTDRKIDYTSIVNMYNDTCVSFPKVKTLSESRKKSIKARLHTYNIEDFKTLFEKAQASDFLKGKNGRDWQASFDWLIKDANMAKVLDGNYDNKGQANKPEKVEEVGQYTQALIKQREERMKDIDVEKEEAEFQRKAKELGIF